MKKTKNRIDKDLKVAKEMYENNVDPNEYMNKYYCDACGQSMPDNRYKGLCFDCYFTQNDVTLKGRR